MTLRRSIPAIITVILMVFGLSLAQAAPGDPVISGPVNGAAGEYLSYTISNPANRPLSILSSTGLWVRSILVSKSDTVCALDDGGTEDIVTCNGDFRVTISSDLGQRIILRLGQVTLTTGISGDHLVSSESLVHIYNGLVPASLSISAADSNPPVTTNALLGDYTSYQLGLLNYSSTITRTFDVTLTVPLDILLTRAPRDCAQQTAGVYRCLFIVGPQNWLTSGFEVRWLTAGVKPLTVVGTVGGVEVGADTRLGNIIVVSTNQLFFPIAFR